MDDIIRVLVLKTGEVLVTKIQEVPGADIGQPDCAMIDPVIYDTSNSELEKALSRFPGKNITADTKMAIHSDNILTMVTPAAKLLSEYLIVIGD